MDKPFRTTCRSCKADIVMTSTTKGLHIPINYDAETMPNALPALYDKEKHISHFATCPHAQKHRKRNNKHPS